VLQGQFHRRLRACGKASSESPGGGIEAAAMTQHAHQHCAQRNYYQQAANISDTARQQTKLQFEQHENRKND
jgi:hypothetical protein